jgi:hypothetical protein
MLNESRRTLLILPLGLALLTFGLIISHTMNVHLFGLSNDFVSGLMMGAGIGVLLIAAVSARQTGSGE